MSSGNQLPEDYVAELLKRDAMESSIKYSTVGIDALLPKRPILRAPKPNTRFLRNLIRETDSHNASLKTKEVEEGSAKLNNLHRKVNYRTEFPYSRNSSQRDSYRIERSRLYSNETDATRLRHRNRRSQEHSPHAPRKSEYCYERKRGRDRDHECGERCPSTRYREDIISEGNARNYHEGRHEVHRRSRRSRSPRERHQSRRHGTRSRSTEYSKGTRDSMSLRLTSHDEQSSNLDFAKAFNKALRRKIHRARSVSGNTSHSSDETESKKVIAHDKREGIKQHKVSSADGHSKRILSTASNYDSDPLESILGPERPLSPPTIRRRGRGTAKGSRGIDAHFSSSYDPTTDIHPNSGSEDDWDQALEAMRDRQLWRQQGANRLRAAGFTEGEISAWEKGGEKREEDVQWKHRGEGREWDRGKVIGSDGIFETHPGWEGIIKS